MSKETQNPIYVHIGYPKSGSTTLQKQFFNKHTEINNLGLFPTDNVGNDSEYIDYDSTYLSDSDLQDFYDNLVMLEGIQYYNSKNERLFDDKILDLITDGDGEITVFSNERFVSAFYAHDDLREKANRLRNLFPDGKILLIIRNQTSLIKSQYRDHPTDPRSFAIGPPVSFNEWIDIAHESDSVNFLESLQYYDVISYYMELFGRENVGIFPLETLIHNTEQFAVSMADYLGIDFDESLELLQTEPENTGVSKRFNNYRRLRWRMLSVLNLGWLPEPIKTSLQKSDEIIQNVIKRGPKEDLEMNSSSDEIIESLYSEQNKKLNKRYNLDLAKFDYPGFE